MIKISPKIRRLWYIPIWRISLLILLGLAVLGLLAKPSYRMFREWKIERNASAATKALAEGDYPEARRLALAVLKLKGGRHDMLVVLRLAMEELDDPNSVNVSRSLMSHDEATEEDLVKGFRASCEGLPLASVIHTWRSLDANKAHAPEYLVPYVTRLIDHGLVADAAGLLKSRHDIDLLPGLRFQAIRLLLKATPTVEHLERAQFEISDLMEEGGGFALPAFRLLSHIPRSQFRSAYFPELEEWVKGQQGATTGDYLLALIQPLQRHPEQEAEIVRKAVDRFANESPAAVARWLVTLGRAQQALDLVPEEDASMDSERFRVRAAALAALKRWDDAGQWVAAPPSTFPLAEGEALRAAVESSRGPSPSQGRVWDLALSGGDGQSNPDDLVDLHQRLREAGFEELSRKTMVDALRHGRGRLPCWAQVRDLLPWLRETQQGRAMFDICSVMASLEPTNIEVVLEALDLACIFGKVQPAVAVERFGKLKPLDPRIAQSNRFHVALASALLADGKADEAVAALGPDWTSDSTFIRNRALAVESIAKAMRDEGKASSQCLAQVDWKDMLREEKQFFNRLLEELEAPGTSEPIGSRFDPKILPPAELPIEDPAQTADLPPIPEDFGKEANPTSLPPITEGIESEFKPKPLPPLETPAE